MKFKLIYGNHPKYGIGVLDTLNLLKHGLEEIGHQAHLEKNICPGYVNILIEYFTFDLLDWYLTALQTPGTKFIIIATEHVTGNKFNQFDEDIVDKQWLPHFSHYDNLSYWDKRFKTFTQACADADAIWHLSEHQVESYRTLLPGKRVEYFPHAYVQSLENFNNYEEREKDIDILFTGSSTPYRMEVLHQLHEKGLKICLLPAITPNYIRNSLIQRSKIALSIKQNTQWKYPSNSRYFYHIMNGPLLVGQKCAFTCDISPYVIEEEDEAFVQTITDLIMDQKCNELALSNLNRFRNTTPLKDTLSQLLDVL